MRYISAIAAGLALFVSACTTDTITPQMTQAPPQTYHTVALGPVDVKAQEFAYIGPFFRKAFIQKLGELKAFALVSEATPDPKAAEQVVVSVTITEVDKGSAVARMLVGFGAGREHVTAQVRLTSPDGKLVGQFESRKAYSGGLGIGGAGFIDIEDLTQKLGEQCAQSVVDWSKGKLVAQDN